MNHFKTLDGNCYMNMETVVILVKHIEDRIEESIMKLFEPMKELK